MTRSLQGFLEELLGRSRVSLSGKPEVDRGAGGIDVPIRKREPQIPTDRANNDLGFEAPPFEQRWPRFDRGMYCRLSDSFTEFLQDSWFLA
jgi:hypothetical protein